MNTKDQLKALKLQATAAASISAALDKAGVTKQQDQAGIVGESPQAWNRHVAGHRGPSLRKIIEWLMAAEQNGHTLSLRLDAKAGCVVA